MLKMRNRHGEEFQSGDEVRLRVGPTLWMIVKRVEDFSSVGVSAGAECEWISQMGKPYSKVYPIDGLTKIDHNPLSFLEDPFSSK